MHESFLKDGNLVKFASEILLEEKYRILRKRLIWDSEAGCSKIIEK